MRALVTGGAGFIGSNLADALVGRGDAVLVLDDLSTGRRENVEDGIALPILLGNEEVIRQVRETLF